jgi:hypothetical protein
MDFVFHRDRAGLSVLPQLIGGYYGNNGHAVHLAQGAGVEFFYQLDYDSAEAHGAVLADPLLAVQALLRGQLTEEMLVQGTRDVQRAKPTSLAVEEHQVLPSSV